MKQELFTSVQLYFLSLFFLDVAKAMYVGSGVTFFQLNDTVTVTDLFLQVVVGGIFLLVSLVLTTLKGTDGRYPSANW